MIVRWPGHIEPGSTTDHLSTHYDFMATLAELIEGTLPKGKDSLSYLPTLLGRDQPREHDYIVINNQFSKMGRTALISREGWKLVEIDRSKDQFQLYHLKGDNEERHNLETKYPERVEHMKKRLLKELESLRPDL